MNLTHNLSLKVASLAIALLLAYGVHSQSNVSVVSLVVPIELKNAPEDRVAIKPLKKFVQVTIKGPSFLVGPVASSPPPLRIQLPDEMEDRVMVSFKATDLSLPVPVDVVSIEPAQMEFVFEPLERREVKVEVPRVGQVAGGLVLENIEVVPKVVAVKGPRTDVRQLRTIETEPINVSEYSESAQVVLNLRPSSALVTPAARSVVARITISQVPSEKEFVDLPLEIRVPRGFGRFAVAPSQVSVLVSAAPEQLAKLSASDVIPYVRMTELSDSKAVKLKVAVDLPGNVKVVRIEPPMAAIEQEEKQGSSSMVQKRAKARGK